jgi:hypothetical protein
MIDEGVFYKTIEEQVRRDIGPVRALAPVWKRSAPLLLIWMLLTALVLAIFGLRPESGILGPWLLWGPPLIQLLAAYAVVMFALRLSIPGSETSIPVLVVIAALGIGLHLAISEIAFRLSPVYIAGGREMHLAIVCFLFTLGLGLIPLAFIYFLSAKGLASRPGILGLVCGLGCGLTGEAAWRMHCPYSSWNHVLVAHSGAVLTTALLGGIISILLFRRRRPLRESKSGGVDALKG